MEKLVKKDNLVNWRDLELTYLESIKVDDNSIHIVFEDRVVLFLINDTELNGITYKNSNEFIAAL